MSLLLEAMEPFMMMDQTTTSDGYGGFIRSWVEGATIKAAVVLNSSMQARTAEVQGVTALYDIITQRNINLQFHDVLKRVSDGKIFRVTSDGDDDKTPVSANLDMRRVSAEEWVLTNGTTESATEQGTSNS